MSEPFKVTITKDPYTYYVDGGDWLRVYNASGRMLGHAGSDVAAKAIGLKHARAALSYPKYYLQNQSQKIRSFERVMHEQ